METKKIFLTPSLVGPIVEGNDVVILAWKSENDPERVMTRDAFYERFPYALEGRTFNKNVKINIFPEEKKKETSSKTGVSSWTLS